MSMKVTLPERFEEKGTIEEYLSDENDWFNEACYGIMKNHFQELNLTDESIIDATVRDIFNDVYSCATNISHQRYREEWGNYIKDNEYWYMLPDGTDFRKFTEKKHLLLFMPMLWWTLCLTGYSNEDSIRIKDKVKDQIREKFNKCEEKLIFSRFDAVLGATEEQAIEAIQKIAPKIQTKRHWKAVVDELRNIPSYVERINSSNPHRGGEHANQILKYISTDIENITGDTKLYETLKKVDHNYPCQIRNLFRETLLLCQDLSLCRTL